MRSTSREYTGFVTLSDSPANIEPIKTERRPTETLRVILIALLNYELLLQLASRGYLTTSALNNEEYLLHSFTDVANKTREKRQGSESCDKFGSDLALTGIGQII